jgi:hypothetical protein
VLAKVGVPGKVELYVYRPGFEAKGIERFVETVRRCHDQVFSEPPQTVTATTIPRSTRRPRAQHPYLSPLLTRIRE